METFFNVSLHQSCQSNRKKRKKKEKKLVPLSSTPDRLTTSFLLSDPLPSLLSLPHIQTNTEETANDKGDVGKGE